MTNLVTIRIEYYDDGNINFVGTVELHIVLRIDVQLCNAVILL